MSIGAFRKSRLADTLYVHTSPRSRVKADELASIALKMLQKKGKIERHGHQHWIKTTSFRTMVSGRKVPETEGTHSLCLITRCPGKWIAVDLENGEIYAGGNGREHNQWHEPSKEEMQDLRLVLSKKK